MTRTSEIQLFDQLERWKRTGNYPRIDDRIVALILERAHSSHFLDLCCGFGLLGQRIAELKQDAVVVGVEANSAKIAAAWRYEVAIPIHHLSIQRSTLPTFIEICTTRRIEVLIARRCIPELFKRDLELGRDFVTMLAHSTDVNDVFLESRARTKLAKSALSCIDKQVALFEPFYHETKRTGAAAHLERSIRQPNKSGASVK